MSQSTGSHVHHHPHHSCDSALQKNELLHGLRAFVTWTSDRLKSSYLGCLVHHKCLFQSEYKVFRDDFTSDGDHYGLDQAVLYTRQVVTIDDVRPAHCFDSFSPAILVLVSVTRLQLTDSKLFGRYTWQGGDQTFA